MPEVFAVKECAITPMATGTLAATLADLGPALEAASGDSIDYHFWFGRVRPRLGEPEARNDFAIWAERSLHDPPLAERLGFINPTHFDGVEALRHALVEVVHERIKRNSSLAERRADEPFRFIRGHIAVFATKLELSTPRELRDSIAAFSEQSIFFHCIDARRRRADGADDLSAWLRSFGLEHTELCDRMTSIDPYFASLAQLRALLAGVLNEYLGT